MKLLRTSPFVLFVCLMASSSWAVTSGHSAGAGGVVLRANVPMGTVLGTGDRVTFEFQTRQDAAVLVFNIDSQGYVHLLYPTAGPEVSRALQSYVVPAEGAELVVDSPTGVEFVFALAVDDPSAIDSAELEHLRSTEASGTEPRRIDGDPFVAANMIAGELVRGVSHQGVYFGYTYFYVNERVEYPCYLCGACDGVPDDSACTDYRVVQTFDRRATLSYPLQRAYETVEAGAEVSSDDGSEGSDVDVNFYPYGVEARAVDPFYSTVWNDWWYDPFYWYGPYYPYYSPGWSIGIGIGWGWGWGWWGGYYCSGWYAPCGWGYCGGYGGYPSGGYYSPPEKFKAKYKSDAYSLTTNRAVATQRDGRLRIASKDVQQSLSRPAQSSFRSKTTGARTSFTGTKGAPRVKTSIGRRSSGQVKSVVHDTWRGSRTTPHVRSSSRGGASTRSGVSNVRRGGGGYKARGNAPSYRGGSRSSSGRMHSSPSSGSYMRSAPSHSRSYSAPSSRGGGGFKGGAPRLSAPHGRGR